MLIAQKHADFVNFFFLFVETRVAIICNHFYCKLHKIKKIHFYKEKVNYQLFMLQNKLLRYKKVFLFQAETNVNVFSHETLFALIKTRPQNAR